MSACGDPSEPLDRSAQPPPTSVDVEIAAGRLLDDESLRGGLSDDGFAQILEVALALVIRRQGRFASTDELATAARSFVKLAVAVAEAGNIAELDAALVCPLFEPGERRAILGADLIDLADADGRARSIADHVARVCALGSA